MSTIARLLVTLVLLAAPVSGRAQTWDGFNAGFHLGYGFGNGGFAVTPQAAWLGDIDQAGIVAVGTAKVNIDGLLFGLHVGYDRRHDQFVFGLIADASLSGLNGSYATPVFPGVVTGIYWAGGTIGSDWLVTLRGRFGVVQGPWLFYATGGLAIADLHFRQSINFLNACSDCIPGLPLTTAAGGANAASGSKVAFGLTLGAGIERELDRGWTIRAEYLRVWMRSSFTAPSRFVSPINGDTFDMLHHARIKGFDLFKIALVYNFRT